MNSVKLLNNRFIADKLNRQQLIVSSLLVAVVVFLFHNYLTSGDLILSGLGHDTANQFLGWRTFGFSQIKQGNFPLWNPHLFSGAPYFGGFQSALLYPFNILFVIFPPSLAVNLSFIFHVLLIGLLSQYWMASKKLHPVACGVAGLIAMLGAAFFLHIYAGHLSNICTMAWAPLLFWVADKLTIQNFKSISHGTFLAGAFAVAMQILAGHPQYFFYTMVSLAIYCLWKVIFRDIKFLSLLNWLPVIAGGILLSALQLFGGIFTLAESVRSSGVSFEFASMFSFPPENLMTLLAPDFFGNLELYWGRHYLWEMSLYIGVTGLLLAVYGATEQLKEKKWIYMATALTVLLISFGKSTFLFSFLFQWVPGFANFRGISKFVFVFQLLLAVLAALGVNRLLTGKDDLKKWGFCFIGFGMVLIVLSVFISNADWKDFILSRLDAGESYFFRERLQDEKVVNFLQQTSFVGIFGAAVMSLMLGALFYVKHKYRAVPYLIVASLVIELCYFSSSAITDFNPQSLSLPAIQNLQTEEKKNIRILNTVSPNGALLNEHSDIWGMDPGVLKRYAEFMTWSQNANPDQANQYVNFQNPNKLYKMLRLKYAAFRNAQGGVNFLTLPDPLPKAFLVSKYRVAQSRDEIFKILNDPDFDAAKEVVLEAEPEIKPEGADGKISVIDENSDEVSIVAELTKPGILIITDNYSSGWRATANELTDYKIMPANYILKAISLGAGSHKIQLEYRPWWFTPLAVVNWMAWIVFLAWLLLFIKKTNSSR